MVTNVSKLSPEQHERHKAWCRNRYQKAKAINPRVASDMWEAKKRALIERGEYEQYMEDRKPLVRQAYARYRTQYLRPDRAKREELIGFLGGKCVHCGYDANVQALVLDHKRGDGWLDRKRVGSKIARYYIKHLDEARENLQVLCYNCNAIKAIEEEHNRSRRIEIPSNLSIG